MDSIQEKAKQEYRSFLEDLKGKTAQEIINAAYEVTIKADIVLALEDRDLSEGEIFALSKLEMPLAAIYDEWLHNDYSYMELLRDTVSDYADKVPYDPQLEKLKEEDNEEEYEMD